MAEVDTRYQLDGLKTNYEMYVGDRHTKLDHLRLLLQLRKPLQQRQPRRRAEFALVRESYYAQPRWSMSDRLDEAGGDG